MTTENAVGQIETSVCLIFVEIKLKKPHVKRNVQNMKIVLHFLEYGTIGVLDVH